MDLASHVGTVPRGKRSRYPAYMIWLSPHTHTHTPHHIVSYLIYSFNRFVQKAAPAPTRIKQYVVFVQRFQVMLFNDHSLNPLSIFSNTNITPSPAVQISSSLVLSRNNWLLYHSLYVLKTSLVFSHTFSLRSCEQKSVSARRQTNPRLIV